MQVSVSVICIDKNQLRVLSSSFWYFYKWKFMLPLKREIYALLFKSDRGRQFFSVICSFLIALSQNNRFAKMSPFEVEYSDPLRVLFWGLIEMMYQEWLA